MIFFIVLAKILAVVLPLLVSVAFLTLLERKIMGSIQRRRGPSVLGFLGLLQPFADGLKLFVKENFIPIKANKFLFLGSPCVFLALSLVSWSLIPYDNNTVVADLHLGILYVLALSSLSVYGLIIAGWASNSQYAFLGALRSAAQMISYEIAIAMLLFTVVIYSGSLNLSKIVVSQEPGWFLLAIFPVSVMFFICSLAETSRPPFDLPEAEAESVSGYNLEYSSMGFAFFFIAEYANIIFMSAMCTLLFLGGGFPPIEYLGDIPPILWFSTKTLFVVCIFIWIRAAFPRFRFDQLMVLSWRVFLPISFSFFVLAIGFCLMLPQIEDWVLNIFSWTNAEYF